MSGVGDASGLGDAVVKQGFYVRPRHRNVLVLWPAILTVAGRRLSLVDHRDRILLDAPAHEVSVRFTRFGLMHLSHGGRRLPLQRQGANWSPNFTTRQVEELKAAGMPVPGLAGGMGGGGGDGLLDAMTALGALGDAADAGAALGSGGPLRRTWAPYLTALGCSVQLGG
ncbi:hypothetical protein ABEG17_03860 [Pedococcus sp. KACC 23699]|uniref:Uncharacterized protein n=1 Tax=Pedococcus sp. KACC 23699 TaxID=3149228 RepID=A0AAU7JW28_9MICO